MTTETTQPIEQLVKSAAVRDLVMLVRYGNTERVQQAASDELRARRLCGNCGSSRHSFCNA